MKVLYVRVSTAEQNTGRQIINASDYNYVIEDRCSGSIAFADRQGGKEVMELLQSGKLTELHVLSIDRLGRNLLDILNTIQLFNAKLIPITFVSQGITTISDGKENAISKLLIGILGTVAEMERTQIKERTNEGIKIAKAEGKFKGRKAGSTEDVSTFLDKPANKLALKLLKQDYPINQVAKLAEISLNTVAKVKRLGMPAV